MHSTSMAKSVRSITSTMTSCRNAWLRTSMIILFVSQTVAAETRPSPVRIDASGARPLGLRRLPPVAPELQDAGAGDMVRPFDDGSVSLASTWTDEADIFGDLKELSEESLLQPLPSWFESVRVGYADGFLIASDGDLKLPLSDTPYKLRMNGWGQLRHTLFDSDGANHDLNQLQLKRGRLTFSGTAFTSDFGYFVQLDGRSVAGDDFRLLDYFLTFDLGHRWCGCEKRVLVFKTGKYKVPFTMARYLSGREFEFNDRSMASIFFDVNRSLAWGLEGKFDCWGTPLHWEAAIFNGLVTGGAETGSSGTLDNNFAYSGRIFAFPTGDWGAGSLADFDWHETLATRVGAGFANSTIDRNGITEFNSLRVVDSGEPLSYLLPDSVDQYGVNIFCVDTSCKLRGWSATAEYYFRSIYQFRGANVPNLFDHGFWLQLGKFILPEKLQLLARWTRVVGDSGTLGTDNQSAEEIAGGLVWYFNRQHARITFDATYLDGAPIRSPVLDIFEGDMGFLYRTQIQFAF